MFSKLQTNSLLTSDALKKIEEENQEKSMNENGELNLINNVINLIVEINTMIGRVF